MLEVTAAQNNGNELPEILISEKQKKSPVAAGNVFNDNNTVKKKSSNPSESSKKNKKKSGFPDSTELTKTSSKRRINIQNGILDCIQVEQFIPFSNPVIEIVINKKLSISKPPISKLNAAAKVVKIENPKSNSVDVEVETEVEIGNNTDLKTVCEKEFTHFPRGFLRRKREIEKEKERNISGSVEGELKAGEGKNDQTESTELRLKFLR